VQAGFDSHLGLFGIEVRHILNENCFDIAVNELLVSLQSAEPVGLRNAESVCGILSDLWKVVGHRVKHEAAVLQEQAYNPITAATAADPSQLDFTLGGRRLSNVRG